MRNPKTIRTPANTDIVENGGVDIPAVRPANEPAQELATSDPASNSGQVIPWHYTIAQCFRQILRDGAIKPARAFVAQGERPVVWLSTSEVWEPSANKAIIVSGMLVTLSMEETARRGGGLIRIGVSLDAAPLDWQAIRTTSGMNPSIAKSLAEIALRDAADPSKWRGSYAAIPREKWIAVQEFRGGAWVPVAGF